MRVLEQSEMIKKILHLTPEGHEDRPIFEQVFKHLVDLFKDVDQLLDRLRCGDVIREIRLTCGPVGWVLALPPFALKLIGWAHNLVYNFNTLTVCSLIHHELSYHSNSVVCEGQLHTIGGRKVQCYLFDKGFVMCRKISKCKQQAIKLMRLPGWIVHPLLPGEGVWFVHGRPIEACRLKVTDRGTSRMLIRNFSVVIPPGSSSSSRQNKTKHVFQLEEEGERNTVKLVAYNEYEKKYWMDCLHAVIKRQSRQKELTEPFFMSSL